MEEKLIILHLTQSKALMHTILVKTE